MKQLDVKNLFTAIHELGKYERTDELTNRDTLTYSQPTNPVLESSRPSNLTKSEFRSSLRAQLESLDLQLTIEALNDLDDAWAAQNTSDDAKAFFVRISSAVVALRTIFKRELANRNLLYLESAMSPYYLKPSAGWENIISALGDVARRDDYGLHSVAVK